MVVNLTRFVCICDYHIIQFIYVHWTRKPWKWQNFRSSVLREFGAYSQSLKVNVGYYCIKEPKDKDDSDASNDHIILSPNRVEQNKKYFETPFLVLLHKEIAKKKGFSWVFDCQWFVRSIGGEKLRSVHFFLSKYVHCLSSCQLDFPSFTSAR